MVDLSGRSLFHHLLLETLSSNWNNIQTNNFDFIRYGYPERDIVDGKKNIGEIERYLDQLESMYFLLQDGRSKELLLQLLAFRMLGHKRVRLPLSQPLYADAIVRLSEYLDKEEKLDVKFLSSSIPLYLADLSGLNVPVRLYTTSGTILTQFLLKQYEYTTDEQVVIGAGPGDVVIDGGACWGDVSLYFANRVGKNGRILAFEFVPDNVEVFKINLGMNPDFESRVKLIERPLWSESRVKTYFKNIGPGTKVTMQEPDGYDGVVETTTIDDVVDEEKLEKVNLIKMDIEGAEQNALKGAIHTIRRFTPNLAITIYHSMDDFANIIHQINNLGLGYNFYLGHFTIFHEETVLFATKQ